MTLVFQNPPNTFSAQEVFGVPNTYSQGIWKTRVMSKMAKVFFKDKLVVWVMGWYFGARLVVIGFERYP